MTDAVAPLIRDAVVPEMTLDGEFSLGELISLAQDKGVILNVPLRVQPEHDVYSKALFQYELEWELHEEYIQSDRYQFAKVLRGILAEGKFFEANILHDLKNARYVGKKLMHAQAQMTALVLNLKRFLKALQRKEITKDPLNEESYTPAAA